MKKYIAIASISIFAIITVLSSCVEKSAMQQEGKKTSSPQQMQEEQVQKQQKQIAQAEEKEPKGPYEITSEPLTPAQCGQCHPQIFNYIKEDGGKHRFVCTNCHEQLHAYKPPKDNYDEIMPKCSNCHIFPHGEQFSGCLDCHQNPHTPLNVPTSAIDSECGNCHTDPQRQLNEYPSKHTTLGCSICHYSHGEVPSCFDCHQPHKPDQPLTDCKTCHKVHKPLEIGLSPESKWNSTCSACHDQIWDTWKSTKSKHGQVNCGQCHTRHGLIPECQTCHDTPHNPNMLKKFPKCLECHIDPHNPPIKG